MCALSLFNLGLMGHFELIKLVVSGLILLVTLTLKNPRGRANKVQYCAKVMQTNFLAFRRKFARNEISAIFCRIFASPIVPTPANFRCAWYFAANFRAIIRSSRYFAANFRAKFHPFRPLLPSSFREKFTMIEIRDTSFSSASMSINCSTKPTWLLLKGR